MASKLILAEHRGCKVWQDVRTTRTRCRTSGAILTTNTPLKTMYVSGPRIRLRDKFRSVASAIRDIDFQLDHCPVPEPTPAVRAQG